MIMLKNPVPFYECSSSLSGLLNRLLSSANGCQLHYHAADSVLTSGCAFISQQIWIEIFIALAILGICIKIETLSVGKRSMCTYISGWHTFNFWILSSIIVTGWHRWHSGRMWHRFWWRCTSCFAPPACLWILCCAILAKNAVVRMIFMNHC